MKDNVDDNADDNGDITYEKQPEKGIKRKTWTLSVILNQQLRYILFL